MNAPLWRAEGLPERQRQRRASARSAWSLRQLKEMAGDRGDDLRSVLRSYAEEEILAALSASPAGSRFPVHGAWAMATWLGHFPRPTSGIDVLDLERSPPDQVVSDLRAAVTSLPAGLDVDWSRARVKTSSRRRLPLHRVTLPVRLEFVRFQIELYVMEARRPAPDVEFRRLRREFKSDGYAWIACTCAEEMIAEKGALLATYGADHSRLKDVFDLWLLTTRLTFDGDVLVNTMAGVFDGRDAARMVLREDGYWRGAFDASSRGEGALTQWAALSASISQDTRPPGLGDTLQAVASFLSPLFLALRGEAGVPRTWHPGGPWAPQGQYPAALRCGLELRQSRFLEIRNNDEGFAAQK